MSVPTLLSDHARHSGRALRYSMSPGTWWSAVTTSDRGQTAVAAAVRVGVAVGLVLVVGALLGHRDIAGFAALGALTSAFCRADPYRIRLPRLVVTAVALVGYVAFGAILGATGTSMPVQVIAMAVAAGLAALLLSALRVVGPGAVVMIFAAAAGTGFAHDAGDVQRAVIAAVVGAAVGVAASLAPWILTAIRGGEQQTAVPRKAILEELRAMGDPEFLIRSARIVAACAIAAGIAAAVGLQHPMWAAMGALASMQGVNYHLTVRRGIQRLLGNAGGAAIAVGLLALPIGYWGVVVVIVFLQIAVEILASVNYALCSLAVTPMALLLTALGAGMSSGVAIDRVVDTAVGVVCGVVIAALTAVHHELGHSEVRIRQ